MKEELFDEAKRTKEAMDCYEYMVDHFNQPELPEYNDFLNRLITLGFNDTMLNHLHFAMRNHFISELAKAKDKFERL